MTSSNIIGEVRRETLEALPAAACLAQFPALVLLDWNENFVRLCPTLSGARRPTNAEALPSQLRSALQWIHERAAESGEATGSSVVDVVGAGSPISLQAHVAPLGGGCHLVTLWDVTEHVATSRRAASVLEELRCANDRLVLVALESRESAAREAAARVATQRQAAELEAVLAAISDPVIVYGADCRVQRANPAARRLFKSGAVGEDIVAVCGHLDARDMEGRPATAEEIAAWRGALAGRIVAGRRYSATTPDGEHLVLEPVVAPLHHGDRVTGAVGVWRDVTDRERLIADLGASNAALAESHRRKDEFLAMLGHELRNPLGAISTAARAIRLLLERSEDVEPSLAILERQVGSAARLLEDLLDVSRITRGLIHLRKEVVSLGAIVGQVAETQRAAIDVAGHRLSVVTPLEPVTVEGDPTRLEQIAANLLNNAVKYTPTGGSIEVEVESSDDRALLKVRDTGVGIAPDLLPHVFDLFVQGETTLARSQGGLGIGLTLVRRLVELHGGTIEAHSAGRGAGSEFVVTLPEVRRGLPAVSPPKATPVAGARILLVEDNVDAADVLSEYLRASGHQVAVAHDGEAALCRAAECFPDIVLLDIGLPGIDGYEVARRLRANISERVPYVIALSGYAQEDDMRRSQEAGCALHLTKPVSAEVLDQAIAGALESVPPAVPDQGMSS